MLIKATISNMFSFENETVLDFSAGREQIHSQYISYVKKYRKKIVPALCLFGPNGAGKTCFFKSIKLVQSLVLAQTFDDQNIKVEPFLLSSDNNNKSSICLEFLAENDYIYRYKIQLSPIFIYQESLEKLVGGNYQEIFSRKNGKIHYPETMTEEKKNVLSFTSENTSKNQLILNKRNQILSKYFDDIDVTFKWFGHISFVTPDTRFIPFSMRQGNYEKLTNLLNEYGFNIEYITGEECSFDIIPSFIKKEIESNLTPKKGAITIDSTGEFIVTYKEKEKIKSIKLCCWHKNKDGIPVRFNLQQESDGIRRVIEVSPIFNILSNGSKERSLIVIDELDRGLHPLLTKHIIRKFIKNSSKDTRNQLIFTSHDLSIIERETLRQDQIFIVGKNKNHATYIEKLNDSNIRSDKGLRKYYLEGNLGGLPLIENIELH